MRTFIVAHDGQGMLGDMPAIKVVKLKDFRKLMKHMGFLYDDADYEHDGEKIPTNNELIKAFHNANGDGTAFYLVKELINGEVVNVPEFKVVK